MLRRAPQPKYLALLRMQLQQGIAYPLGTLLDLLAVLLSAATVYYLWRAVFGTQPRIAGFDWPAMQSYVLISNAIFALLAATSARAMMQSIRTGAIASELLRPYSYLAGQLTLALGRLLSHGLLSGIALVLVGFALVGMAPPPTLAHGTLFIVSVALSFLIGFLLNLLLATLCFWTHDSEGLTWAYAIISFVFSGGLVPLALLPGWLRALALLLPFHTLIHTPLIVYLGTVDLMAIARALAIQAAWAAVLWAAVRLLWARALHSVEIQGG